MNNMATLIFVFTCINSTFSTFVNVEAYAKSDGWAGSLPDMHMHESSA